MFKNNFVKLCNKKGVAPTVVCQAIGLTASAFTNWSENSVPRRATLQKFADYFGVSVEELVRDNSQSVSENDTLSESKRKLLDFAKAVPEDKVDLVLKIMKSIVESD